MGLSVVNLANLLGVSRTLVHEYENGSRSPGVSTLARIFVVLDQPESFFYQEQRVQDFSHELVHFRARNSLKDDLREQAGIRLKWLAELYAVLEEKLALPSVNLPVLDVPADVSRITQQDIEDAATAVRTLWKVGQGPIPDLIRLIELNGGVVGQINLDLPDMDGLSFWSEERRRPYLLLNADKASYVRSRFDAGHELGHMLLHRHVNEGRTRKTPLYELMENQAHRFAGALLLPRETWLADVKAPTLAEFKRLKPKWKASIAAMVMRAEAVGLIGSEQKKDLFKQLRRKKWQQQEPFDSLWELEQPRLVTQATTMLFDSGFDSLSFSQWFPRRTEHTVELTRMPRAYFEIGTLPIKNIYSNFN
ncbi:helix-turn-helix domain-containing protein [Deinococcus irradiatisoli]|nr:ImmA/IrrE family metallo-endopeptidase [Deinococcus irradiatisoli]